MNTEVIISNADIYVSLIKSISLEPNGNPILVKNLNDAANNFKILSACYGNIYAFCKMLNLEHLAKLVYHLTTDDISTSQKFRKRDADSLREAFDKLPFRINYSKISLTSYVVAWDTAIKDTFELHDTHPNANYISKLVAIKRLLEYDNKIEPTFITTQLIEFCEALINFINLTTRPYKRKNGKPVWYERVYCYRSYS